jgi:four helix bundle protein
MGKQQGYRELKVWQQAIEMVPAIYQLVRKLPREETYALGDQIRRAAVSIPANIAEGQARQHTKEFLQHLWIAKGSLAELDTLLIVAEELGYIEASELAQISRRLRDLRMPLQGLINTLHRRTED